MRGIFISYRRDDASGYARLLYDRLVREFGNRQVFMDVEDLREPGLDFVEAIQKSVGGCSALVALIGKTWVSGTDADGRRLDDEHDFVRLEVGAALKRNVRVIPVLVQGARMPGPGDLPQDLLDLTRRQALTLSHEDFEHDTGKLVSALANVRGLKPIRRRTASGDNRWSTRSVIMTAAAAVVATLSLILWGVSRTPNGIGIDIDPRREVPGTTQGTTRPAPVETPAQAQPQAPRSSRASVLNAQQLLQRLGYSPGSADGVIGPATTAAIREFQDDEGLARNGQVDEALLAQLREALEIDESANYGTAAASAAPIIDPPGSEPGPAARAPAINLTDLWYDDNGAMFQFVQSGDRLSVAAFNPYTQQFEPIGEGRITGRSLNVRYSNANGIGGTVTAQIDPDTQHLRGEDTSDALPIPIPNVWHRNHLPGQ